MKSRVALVALLPLALVACGGGASTGEGTVGEQLAGYGILALFLVVLALCAGLVVLGIGGLAYFAGATTLVLNVVRPSPATRTAGVVVGVIDVVVGALGLALATWLAMHGTDDHTIHVDFGGYRAYLPLLGCVGLGVANFVMALAPQRLLKTTATSTAPRT